MSVFSTDLALKKKHKCGTSSLIFESPETLTFLQKFGASIQQCSSYHHHRGGAITSLNVLGFGQFHQLKHRRFKPQVNDRINNSV